MRSPTCSVCGRPSLGTGGPLVCRNHSCHDPQRPLEAVYAAGNYDGALRRAIVAYKYGFDLRWARTFASMLHGFLTRHATWFEEYSVICPVPSYCGPGARRQFGHVELFCSELAFVSGAAWPVERLLVKVAETEPMSNKSRAVRRRVARSHLPGAMRPAPGAAVRGRRLLLVDDVSASGETLLVAARALRGAGAAEVAALVLARAAWRAPALGAGP